jgi:hypothetical protein
MTHFIFLVLGIFVLCSFYTFSVISFHKHRLPKKLLEYKELHRLLGKDVNAEEEERQIKDILHTDYKGTDYILPLVFVTLFCALGFYVLFAGNPPLILTGVSIEGRPELDQAKLSYAELSLVAIGMAILGSYVWSIQYIVRRLVTLDIAPGAYYSIGTRIIFATFVSLVFHHFIQSMDAEIKKEALELLPVLAFFTGIFPQRAMQYMHDKVFFFSRAGKKAHQLPLDMIEGMTLFIKVRLAEVGIDNAQNLAEGNLEKLILKTPFNPRLLLDWIAQARLYVVFKDEIGGLRKAGIRTVFDFQTAGKTKGFEVIAELSNISKERLSAIYEVFNKDPEFSALDDVREKISRL